MLDAFMAIDWQAAAILVLGSTADIIIIYKLAAN
jgi:hypothetical protein